MKIIISGQHIEISPHLKHYIEEHVERYIKKHFQHFINAHVTLAKKNRKFYCHIVVHEGETRKILNSDGSDFNIYASIAQSIHRMEERLQRYKDKLRDHHIKAKRMNQAENAHFAQDNELSPEGIEQQPIATTTSSTLLLTEADHRYSGLLDEHEATEITKNELSNIYKSSLEDAISEFELLGEPFHIFINSADHQTYILSKKQDRLHLTLLKNLS